MFCLLSTDFVGLQYMEQRIMAMNAELCSSVDALIL